MAVKLPLVAILPLHAPDAVQLCAFDDDQVNMVDAPSVMELDANVSVGVGGTILSVTEAG
jgi:hypothetical protein